MKSLRLFPQDKVEFGQQNLMGQRKESRPFSSVCPIHLVLKAKAPVFEIYKEFALEVLQKYAKKYNIQIFCSALNWDHIHLLIQATDKQAYTNFVRVFCSAISRRWGYKGLFEQRPYTRLVRWGRNFQNVKKYIEINQIESRGYSKTQARRIWRGLNGAV